MAKLKKLFSVALILSLTLSLVACSDDNKLKFNIPTDLSVVETSVLAENNNYTLEYDDSANCVLLKDKSNDYVWSNIPYEAYLAGDTKLSLNSDVFIDYYDLTDSSTQSDKSYSCVSDGTYSSEKIKNGIRITYYFSVAEAVIPIEYTLEKNGIRATIVADKISETGKTKLISVSMSPYLCSLKNTSDRNSYLVLPVGSGAIMYTDDEVSSAARSFSGEIYGRDAARFLLDDVQNEETVNCPVFGAKTADNHGLFAIIDKGAESAILNASAGSTKYGYSNVYASFNLRGYDRVEQIIGTWRSDSIALSNGITKGAVYSVCYYPMSDGNCDYSSMAKFYRDYLTENGKITQSKANNNTYLLNILGGVKEKEFILGVPKYTVKTMTSYEQVLSILKEISKDSKTKPNVVMSGFGKDGINYGTVGNGFKFSGKYGSTKTIDLISSYCNSNKISMFANFDLMLFTKSGRGYSASFDTAKSANLQAAAISPLRVNLRDYDKDAEKIHLLKREKLDKSVSDFIKVNKNASYGLGMGKLGDIAYSDYSRTLTNMKGNTEKQIENLIRQVKKTGKNTLLQSANSYAAGMVDTVTDVPIQYGRYTGLDETIPFYQTVFRGSTLLYGLPINYMSDETGSLLRHIEFGVYPSYTVVAEHVTDQNKVNYDYLSSCQWSAVSKQITKNLSLSDEYFKKIGDAKIESHEIISEKLRKTKFDNGLVVYVNYSNKTVNYADIEIPSESFVFSAVK